MSAPPQPDSRPRFSQTQISAMRAKRRARRRRRRGLMPSVNIAPMIDVSFLLLIFFLVTTTFERAEGILSSSMPKETGAHAAVALPISPIVVRVSKSGPGIDNITLSIDRFNDVPQDFDALPEFLQSIFATPGFDHDTPVVIVAGNDVAWDNVVGCWNAAVRAGAKKIAFAEP